MKEETIFLDLTYEQARLLWVTVARNQLNSPVLDRAVQKLDDALTAAEEIKMRDFKPKTK